VFGSVQGCRKNAHVRTAALAVRRANLDVFSLERLKVT
jgi:hypothetical protein